MSKKVVRVGDLTGHSMPIQGAGSPDIFIAGQKAWRALPAGVGAGLDEASKSVKQIMDKPPFTPPEVLPELPKIAAQMTKVAAQAEAAGAVGASATVSTAFAGFTTQATALAATYTAGAAVPGGEPAARMAFTLGFQTGLAQTMSNSVKAIAGSWDMTNCLQAGPAGPHGPGLVIVGCKTVFFNNLPAVVEGHVVQEASGGPATINIGAGTVFIGDVAPSGGGGNAGGQDDAGPKGELDGGVADGGAADGGPPKAGPTTDGGSPPADPAHQPGHLAVTSETVAHKPSPRSRVTIGVGEGVRLNATGATGPVSWKTTGKSKLSAKQGVKVLLTAGGVTEKVTITATDSCGCTAETTFDVIEPSGVKMVRAPGTGTWHVHGVASVGLRTKIYVTPGTVSFENVEISEDDCVGVVTGYFVGTPLDGVHHAGHGAGNWVRVGPFADGKGSAINGTDTVQSGKCNWKTYAAGTFDWPIPWRFRVGGGAGKVFTKVHQRFTIDAAGDMTAGKAGAHAATKLNDPSSNY